MAMDADDRLRLDYDQTNQLIRTLTDVRFKLLAFVPTIAGTAVAFIGRPRPAAELLAVGAIGLLATLGVFFYELRNTQIHDWAVKRASELERRLGLGSAGAGGLYGERPSATMRLFGVVAVSRDRALALVYAAALAAWTYLMVWGGLKALDVGAARKTGAVVAVVVALVVILELERIDRRGP
jgi:hypothetical protein